MLKHKLALLTALSFVLAVPAWASSTRTIDGDAIISSGHTTTWTPPAGASGALMISAGLIQEVPSGTVNGSNVTFTLANTPGVSASVILSQDGKTLTQGSGKQYTISGVTITMATAPATGQSLWAVYSKY